MRRRTRWAALLLVNTAACAPGRGTTRTTVIGDGVAGSTTELAGEPWRAGGGLGVRHKRGSGAVVGAQVRVVDSPAIWGATSAGRGWSQMAASSKEGRLETRA